MYKKRLSLICIICSFLGSVFAQTPETHPRHENHYKYIAPIISDEIKIEVTNMHSQINFAQIKLRITNKTNDFMAVKSDEIIFHMNGVEYRPKGKVYMIGPRDYITRSIRVDGDNRFHVDNFTVELRGFYRIPADGIIKHAENFNLPNSKNDFEFEGFECKVAGRIIQGTQITELPLRCIYTGDKVGLIEASRISVKLENGMEFANVNTGSKIKNLTTTGSTDVIFPGEKTKIMAVFRIPAKTADMQFSNLIVHFNDTFSETELIPIAIPAQDFVLDQTKTELKNK
ncbi:MAG: hypothetical protein JKY42_00880 [Flavobacteriales bacterium]|nr:hypothetical protein [Flavobacteriales bacterium]